MTTRIRGLGAALATVLGLTASSLTASVPASGGAAPAPTERTLRDSRIDESSGLAHSTYPRSAVFTHNDSGDRPRVFMVTRNGVTRTVIRLSGARAKDWEDISDGPKHRIWVGDIGDNQRARKTIQVYRFREPRSLPFHGRRVTVRATKFSFRYPDRARDAETLLVHPRTGRLYIVTKSGSNAGVYAAPKRLTSSRTMRLTRVSSAPPNISAGAFGPSGRKLVLVNGTHAYTYRSIGSAARVTSIPPRRQGESVEIVKRGRRMLLGTEGRPSPVYNVPAPRAPRAARDRVDSQWRLQLDQQFRSFDTDVWRRYDGESWGRDDARVLARNLTVDDGILRIQAKKENADGRRYTTGEATTAGRYSLPTHFRVEVRAKVPFQQGMWAAPIWLRPTDGSAGEIDMVETYGQERNRPSLHQTIHTEYGSGHRQKNFSYSFSDLPGTATGWHTYVVEKTPGKIVMWVDGRKTAQFDAESAPWYSEYYDTGKRWILRTSLQVGGADGLPDSSTNWDGDNTAMQLDRVRTWVLR